jgi:hypothetical protein
LCHPIPGYCWHGSSESEFDSGKWGGGGGVRDIVSLPGLLNLNVSLIPALWPHIVGWLKLDSLCCPNQMAWDNLLFRSLLQILIQVLACVQIL